MKIVEPSVELIDEINPDEVLKKIERCGRVCYQSGMKNAQKFIRMLIKRGHESVLEHVSLTFRIICDRAIQNELVRHRHASFSVESTRFCKYNELTFVKLPEGFYLDEAGLVDFEKNYRELSEQAPPDITRVILPLCLKSELFMTANLREWRHILKLRTHKNAHPQMQFLMKKILDIFKEKLPVIVEDIEC